MYMRCYVFLSDEYLLTWLTNVINCICIYTNIISTQSIITYSSLGNIAPGFSMVEHQLVTYIIHIRNYYVCIYIYAIAYSVIHSLFCPLRKQTIFWSYLIKDTFNENEIFCGITYLWYTDIPPL